MTSENFTIVFVMDKSGSMTSMNDEPWQGLNSFITEQKSLIPNFKFTLCFFNNKVEFIYKNLDSEKIPLLKKEDYKPESMTALYDAIGKTIEFQLTQSKNNVIFVILTDGLENCSNEFDNSKIKKMINDMETENKWKIIYLGANKDAY